MTHPSTVLLLTCLAGCTARSSPQVDPTPPAARIPPAAPPSQLEAEPEITVAAPHVVRGMEVRRGHLIAYSLGSFANYGGINVAGRLGVSLILEAHLAKDGAFRRGRVHAIRQAPPGRPALDPKGEVVAILRELSAADFGETAVTVTDRGELVAP
jgi:Bacterial capsule synthesis protein PGA_cap